MESNQLVKQARIRAIVMGTALGLAFLGFLYGTIQSQLATSIETRLVTCKEHATELAKQLQAKDQQLMLALEETRKAKEIALEQASIAAKRK